MFEIEAEKFLLELVAKIEEKFEDVDVDFHEGVLSISTKQGNYAINKHSVTQSIWFSSPVSSLKYFILQNGVFVDKKNYNLTLEDAILNDLIK